MLFLTGSAPTCRISLPEIVLAVLTFLTELVLAVVICLTELVLAPLILPPNFVLAVLIFTTKLCTRISLLNSFLLY
jgi:hypothetical protein